MENLMDELTKASEGEFMQPYIVEGTFYMCEDKYGESYIFEDFPETEEFLEVTEVTGFLAYVAADGYLDREDIDVFETEDEAIQALIDYYIG